MRGAVDITGANPAMAHPFGYALFMGLMFSSFLVFVTGVLAQTYFGQRETAVLCLGFAIGGVVYSWLLGAFDGRYGLATAAGQMLPVLGVAAFVARTGKADD